MDDQHDRPEIEIVRSTGAYEGTLIKIDHADGSSTLAARDTIQDVQQSRKTVADLMDGIVNHPDIRTVGADAEPAPTVLTLAAWLKFRERFGPPSHLHKHGRVHERLTFETFEKTAPTPEVSAITQSHVWRAPIVEPPKMDPALLETVKRRLHRAMVDMGDRMLRDATIGVQSPGGPEYTDRSQTYVDAAYTVVEPERPALGPGTQPADDDEAE